MALVLRAPGPADAPEPLVIDFIDDAGGWGLVTLEGLLRGPGAAAGGQVCSVHMLRVLYLWTFDGFENFGGNFAPKAIMQGLQFNGDGTTFNPFGTVNIGGTIIIDATGGVGTYTVNPDCTGTLSITNGPTFNIYVGPGAQKVWTLETSPSPAGLGVSVGTATRLPGR